MKSRIHVAIAVPSIIIRNGIISVLKYLPELNIDIAEITDVAHLTAQLSLIKPDILIIDPSNLGVFSLQQIKSDIENDSLKYIALQSTIIDDSVLKRYDGCVSIYDSIDTIKNKLLSIIKIEDEIKDKKELSPREKEVVVCIVKGLSNKQIAEELFLSTHTVMTHRKNISTKLQIHSSAGLTIYAIVNKFVELNDIKDSIFSTNPQN